MERVCVGIAEGERSIKQGVDVWLKYVYINTFLFIFLFYNIVCNSTLIVAFDVTKKGSSMCVKEVDDFVELVIRLCTIIVIVYIYERKSQYR